eukprot:s3744_g2.t1
MRSECTEEYIAAHLAAVRLDHDRLLAAIPTVPSLQAAFLILLYCAVPRPTYLLRALSPDCTADFAHQHDAAVLRCLQALLGSDPELPPGARERANLPLHLGGLRFRSAHAHRAAAYWASWADTLPALRQHWPPVADRLAQLLMGESRDRPFSVTEATSAAASLRRAASSACDQDQFEALLPTYPPHERALLLSQAGPHASMAFTTAPTTPEYTLDNPHFRILLQRRLCLPLGIAPARCPCGGTLDPYGDHRSACPTCRHLRVRAAPMERAVARILREAGARVSTPGLRRASNRGAAQHAAATIPGDAIQRATARKRASVYPEFTHNRRCRLVVVALETGGRWGREAVDGSMVGRCQGREEFERRIARLELELQNAAALPPVVSTVNQPVEGKLCRKEIGKTQVGTTLGDFGDVSDFSTGRKEAKALIKKLRAQRILEAAPAELEKSVERAKVSLSAAVDRLAQDLYELEGHFVFELVQNADDNCYQVNEPELCLSLHQTGAEQFFMSWNNERGLTERDVLALCDVNASAKRSGCIGKKGIGWKSTFAVSNCPHVLSGSWSFKFDVDSLGKLGYVTPTWLSDKELKQLPVPVQDAHRQGGTLIYLPLFSGFSGIVEAFENLLQNHATLLFLKRLCRISFRYPDGKHIRIQRVLGEDQCIYKTEQTASLDTKDSNDSSASNTGSNSNKSNESNESDGACDGDGDGKCQNSKNSGTVGSVATSVCFRYAVHHFRVAESDVKAALGPGPGQDEITLRLAFPLDRCEDSEDLSVMAVHVGLPVRAVGFCFAIDGPFDLVASRRDLHEGSAVNRLICDAIPNAFREFMATAPRDMGSMAMKLVGADVVPRPLWRHVRQKLLESLTQVACVLTECGEVCAPSSCIERPKHPLALRASELIPPKLLKISCDRRFASQSPSSSSSSSLETLSLAHWVKVLSYRGGDWPHGLIAEVTSWENPCDFFLPFCRWLEMELKEAEQPSEILNQIWDLDLLPAFRSHAAEPLQPLRLSSGHIFARPCVKIRTEWQAALCDAEVLRIVEPRCRCALQGATPFLLESLTWPSPTRAELAAACIRLHQMDFDPFAVAEPMSMKAVLASLACLKEAFLADEVLEPEVTWKELGKRLWIPSIATKRVVLQRPSQLSNCSFLGAVVGSAEGTVSLEISQISGKGEHSDHRRSGDLLGWEAFFDAIGVTPLNLSDVSDSDVSVVELGPRDLKGPRAQEKDKGNRGDRTLTART